MPNFDEGPIAAALAWWLLACWRAGTQGRRTTDTLAQRNAQAGSHHDERLSGSQRRYLYKFRFLFYGFAQLIDIRLNPDIELRNQP